ncbi:MAG: nitrilase-related carbon-nitrogen hydrolase [Chitinophagaceae bacterium]|nr:nitrilase-related carbon-nitrogen hydrolase [Chitinophagaceae bacterium]
MKKILRIVLLVFAVLLTAYFTWSFLGRSVPPVNVQLYLDSTFVLNVDSGKGNVIGINPYMETTDYASKEHFQKKIEGYLIAAKEKGWLNEKSVIVFPEYIGAWLVLEGEKNSVYEAETSTGALTTYVASNFFSFLKHYFIAPDSAEDIQKHAAFAMKGAQMAKTYQEVFETLAKNYKVTIIAGSILLPNPVVKKGKIKIQKGSLYNVTAIFNPDGSIQPQLVKKVYPTADELPFITKCPPSEIPVFDLPIGRSAVLICADSWYPDCYDVLKDKNPRFIAVPSYTSKDGSMKTAWKGYSCFEAPAYVDKNDMGKITLGEAWMKYTLPARIKTTGAPYGITVSLRGKLWDLGADGEIIAVNRSSVFTPSYMNGASMVCMWVE